MTAGSLTMDDAVNESDAFLTRGAACFQQKFLPSLPETYHITFTKDRLLKMQPSQLAQIIRDDDASTQPPSVDLLAGLGFILLGGA